MADIVSQKRALRRDARAKRAVLAQTIGTAAATAIRDNLLSGFEVEAGCVVAGYWPMSDEADVRPLLLALQEAGIPCALPVIVGANQPLIFRRWVPEDPLVDNHYGIAEPDDQAEIVTPGLLLVPLIAFDRRGFRLGQGGGYYDRTLEALRTVPAGQPTTGQAAPLAIGIAFAGQEVDSVPHDRFDQLLDGVVTEDVAIPFG